tara:strand:+ start:1913 stop:2518 length:606 start_codon:yes stop_codon:yes gene_type:complete
MAENIITQPPIENPPKEETPKGEVKKEEGTIEVEGVKYIPLKKYVASSTEAIRLKNENEDLRKPAQEQIPKEIPEEEKTVRNIIDKREKERENEIKETKVQVRKDLDDLHTIYGDFDEKKLLSIVDRYGTIGDDGNVNYFAAMELYEKFGGEVPKDPLKTKVPQSTRETAIPSEEVETVVDVSKKSLPELVQEGLKKRFGL